MAVGKQIDNIAYYSKNSHCATFHADHKSNNSYLFKVKKMDLFIAFR